MSGHVDIVAFEVVCGWFVSPAPLFTTFLAVWLSGNALALINVVVLRLVMDDSRIRNRKSRFFSGNLKNRNLDFFPISAVDFAQC